MEDEGVGMVRFWRDKTVIEFDQACEVILGGFCKSNRTISTIVPHVAIRHYIVHQKKRREEKIGVYMFPRNPSEQDMKPPFAVTRLWYLAGVVIAVARLLLSMESVVVRDERCCTEGKRQTPTGSVHQWRE